MYLYDVISYNNRQNCIMLLNINGDTYFWNKYFKITFYENHSSTLAWAFASISGVTEACTAL